MLFPYFRSHSQNNYGVYLIFEITNEGGCDATPSFRPIISLRPNAVSHLQSTPVHACVAFSPHAPPGMATKAAGLCYRDEM